MLIEVLTAFIVKVVDEGAITSVIPPVYFFHKNNIFSIDFLPM